MQTVTTNPVSRTSFAPPATQKKSGWGWPVFWIVVAGVVLFLIVGGIKVLQFATMFHAAGAMVPPPTTVTSAKVLRADWQPTLSAVGSISPVQGATLSAELAGRVSEIDFSSGAHVNKGDLLLKLDTSSEDAQLRSAQADLALAKADFDRARNLSSSKVISKSEFDSAQSKFNAAQAAVDNMQATIDKKQIRAPFSGNAGIRYVNPGQMVGVGDKLLSLQTLDQVFVDFSLPQENLAKVTVGDEVHVRTDAMPGREFTGKLTAINSSIDPATRSVQLQASLDNKDHVLRAGMFAKVQVLLPQKNSTLYIPSTAVSYAPYGDSVYVIEKQMDEKTKKEGLVLRQAFIRLGEARGDFVAVTEGLKEGEEIVSTGAFKLRNKMSVVVDNKYAPKAQLTPHPEDT